MELNIAMYTLSFILGAVVGILILRIVQLDAEQKEFGKQNKNGNIVLAPAPRSAKAHAEVNEWRDYIIHNEGRN